MYYKQTTKTNIMATFRNENMNEREMLEAKALSNSNITVKVRNGKYGRKYMKGYYNVTVEINTMGVDGMMVLRNTRSMLNSLNLKMQ